MNTETEKSTEIHLVSINLTPGGETPALQRIFYVRHHTPASARNWLLENAVKARKATQADVVAMCKLNIEPIGLADPDAYPAPPPTREGHID